jgi:hypothetical protein
LLNPVQILRFAQDGHSTQLVLLFFVVLVC